LCWGVGRLAEVGLKAAFRRNYVESELARFDVRLSAESKITASKIKKQLTGNPAQFAEFIDVRDIFEEQVRLVRANPFVEGRKIDTEVVNFAFAEKYGLPPHKRYSLVEDLKSIVDKDVFYCVEYRTQPRPGNFFGNAIYQTEKEAREKLAIIWDLKGSHDLVLRKYEVKKSFLFRKSIAGAQFDPILKREFEGGNVQFEIPDEVKVNWTEYFVETDPINGTRKYLIELKPMK